MLFMKTARWCNGSTTDSGSVSLGSNPGRAANDLEDVLASFARAFFHFESMCLCFGFQR